MYVNLLVEERLADDPNRLTAFRNLAQHFHNNRNCHNTRLLGLEMIRQMFGEHNQDLTIVYYLVVQEQYEVLLRIPPPQFQTARLLKLARMCYCVQFQDLYRRQGFPVSTEAYAISCKAAELFNLGLIPEHQLLNHLNHVFFQFPGFRNQFEARLNRLTSLFRGGGRGGAGNNPGAGNPPPNF